MRRSPLMNDLLYEVRGTTGFVTLNRPQARNALTMAMYAEIARICRQTTLDSGIKALVISGAGDRAFAAGTDMAQFRDFSEPQHALDYESNMDRVLGDI